TYPVLLLDDIFSEFDLDKRKNLLKFINSLDIQSILTTTDLKNISKRYVKDSYIYNVKNGNVERM
ncbi:MAG: DNA replication and repair protein RecF, partial [Bacilli bacterium]|nr:DNA replication and repair protein RecF [Bacilli bacterium]